MRAIFTYLYPPTIWNYAGSLLPVAVGFIPIMPKLPELVILNLLILATGNLAGLACVWAALGRPHWFWRIATVTIVASLALLIPADELLIWFFTQAMVTIPPMLIIRSRNARHESANAMAPGDGTESSRSWLQWSLRDQLLFCLLLSGIIAAAVRITSETWAWWLPLFLLGLLFGLSTLVGTWAAFSKRRLWLRLVGLCLLPPSAIIACWLGMFRTSRRLTKDSSPRPRTIWTARAALATLSFLLCVPPTAAVWLLMHPVPIPALPELPNPNGFEDLVRAGKATEDALTVLGDAGKLTRTTWTDPTTGSDVELRDMTSATAEALAIARLGLDKPCQVPFSYSHPRTLDHMSPLRALRTAFWAEGELAEREGRKEDAMRGYMDMIRVGYGMSHGGDTTDVFLGAHVFTLGAERLHDIRAELESTHCAELAKTITQLESDADPWAELNTRDFAGTDLWCGWQWRITMRINGYERRVRDGHRSLHAKTRLVICGLALQAYHLDHDAWPESLADLTPEYLPEVPEDPFMDRPVVYYCDGPGYQLYCLPPETGDWNPERRSAFNFSYDGSEE